MYHFCFLLTLISKTYLKSALKVDNDHILQCQLFLTLFYYKGQFGLRTQVMKVSFFRRDKRKYKYITHRTKQGSFLKELSLKIVFFRFGLLY